MEDYPEARHTERTAPESPPVFIATSPALAAFEIQVAREPALAVDTESDSLYSYFEKVCLLQISTRDADYILDPLALPEVTDLAPLLAEPRIEKVFHAAEYDILCLKRDYHFQFENIFDTMIAARILGWKNVGLGSILQEQFGVAPNKKMQRADWSHRPLTAEQIAYARQDTHYLLALRDRQIRDLERLGRLEEAREEFRRLAQVTPTPRRFDPEAYWNIPGARDLDPNRLGILRELFRFREDEARKQDRPPFKILSDAALLKISYARPTSMGALGRIEGMSSLVIQRYGEAVLRAVARGRAAPQTATPHPRSRAQEPLDNLARAQLAQLKDWRRKRAAARGVAPDVIVSNDVLFAIARKNPPTLEALVAAGHLTPWKAQAYGPEMLSVLHGAQR